MGILFMLNFSCTKGPEELYLDPETQTLVDLLEDELVPLDKDPLTWEDQDLRWLDPLANRSVIGLGEATHGTAEFFDAKHRIFRYLVENHGHKIFAIEADFGESLIIDEAVQQGNTTGIEALMESKMHFWTWKTEEVKDMLVWMCTYNQGKAEEEKVHYMGIDCQFNTYHIDMAKTYLEGKGLPFLAYADSLLQVAESAYENSFESFNSNSFDTFIQKLESLQDSMTVYKNVLVGASTEKEYQLHARIVEVIRQVSEVRYSYTGNVQTSMDYRDKYMAQNTAWLLDYYDNEKIVVWAHNYHISNFESGVLGTMGNYLSYQLGDQYASVGFIFSQGTFTAVSMEGETFTAETQTLDSIPQEGSLNALMSYTNRAAFSIELEALRNYLAWHNAFEKGMDYFFMGSGYTNHPGDYYVSFDPDLYDYLIYFDRSTASALL